MVPGDFGGFGQGQGHSGGRMAAEHFDGEADAGEADLVGGPV